MDNLEEGIRKFQREVFPKRREEFRRLAEGQSPDTLFVGCSDSRVDPNLLTQTQPGELFVLRNAGNIVPPYGASTGGELAAVEYAVSVLGVAHIIVCGHSGCGAIGALLDPESTEDLPAVAHWLRMAEATKRLIREQHADAPDDEKLTLAIRANVTMQLANLATHPTVASGLHAGSLTLHGLYYQIETGAVEATEPAPGGGYRWRELTPNN